MVGTWKELNESIASMTEDDVKASLDAELTGKRRWTIVKRLHQRACALRAARERAVLKAACGPAVGVQLDNGKALYQMPTSQIADGIPSA